jgi:Zn-dependent metalloprotease
LVLVGCFLLGFVSAQERIQGSAPMADRDDRMIMSSQLADRFLAREGAAQLGLRSWENLKARSVSDDGAGVTHVRYDSFVGGIRVFDGEVIVHVDPAAKTVLGLTNGHRHIDTMDGEPLVDGSEAAANALYHMKSPAFMEQKPSLELVFYPNGRQHQLAWLVDVFVETEDREPEARMFVIDAYSGEILDSWDNLHTYTPGTGIAKVGTAKTLYLNQLSIDTEQYTDLKYGMVDKLSGNSYTTDMLNKRTGTGTLFSDADNIWGNFLNTDRATAGTDAHLGMSYTFQYYKIVHGRNGIYNDGLGVYSRVHYGRSYNNAFWSSSCKCMTYGDGDGSIFTPLVSLDVAAHEMSHGVTAATANLVYSGESGGLNESTSDIFGAAVEFWANNAKDVPDWWIGEMIYTPSTAGDALRYMDDPRRDGRSIDHYSLYTSTLDVHYSSGLANNFFYLLANGGTNRTSGIAVSGIGISKAERIWYVALTGYMTSTCTFAQARTATVNAATQLYGSTSVDVQRVKDAWTACGVN